MKRRMKSEGEEREEENGVNNRQIKRERKLRKKEKKM